MTETLTYIAIHLLIGWLMVEGAIASKEEDELLTRVLSMYPKHAVGPLHWQVIPAPLYRWWPYYLFRNLILILIDLYNSRQAPHEPLPIAGSDASAARGTVWVPFKMLRERIPMLSAMTLDQLGAKMRCDKCGKRPERYCPANQSDTPRVRSNLLMPWSRRFDDPIQPPRGQARGRCSDCCAPGCRDTSPDPLRALERAEKRRTAT
jgi:hypothetical protein